MYPFLYMHVCYQDKIEHVTCSSSNKVSANISSGIDLISSIDTTRNFSLIVVYCLLKFFSAHGVTVMLLVHTLMKNVHGWKNLYPSLKVMMKKG